MNAAFEELYCEECGGPINQMGNAHDPVVNMEGRDFCSDFCLDAWERRSRQSYTKLNKKPKVKRIV